MAKKQSAYDRLDVTSRVKDCESAILKLRGAKEGRTFDAERPELYKLATLNDLAGVRILVLSFPGGGFRKQTRYYEPLSPPLSQTTYESKVRWLQ